jgi:F-type H+-transporting ATPase subunit b
VADAATAAGAAADHASGGLPQFDLAQWPGQMVWALAIFLVLFLLFRFVFVPRVAGTIEAREDRISGDYGDARRLRDEAEAQSAAAQAELDEARARAHKLAADARNAAKVDAAARQADEDKKLAARLGEAEARIGAARAEAMSHVRGIASETAQAMVERLTGQAASAAELKTALEAHA